jgi:hypothetical protein
LESQNLEGPKGLRFQIQKLSIQKQSLGVGVKVTMEFPPEMEFWGELH